MWWPGKQRTESIPLFSIFAVVVIILCLFYQPPVYLTPFHDVIYNTSPLFEEENGEEAARRAETEEEEGARGEEGYTDYRPNQSGLPHIFYINIAYRKDRKDRLLGELRKIRYPQNRIHRIDAVRKENGALGCGLSHIKALETIQRMNLDVALVLEDDFMWKQSPTHVRDTLQQVLRDPGWSMCLLTCNGYTSIPRGERLAQVKDCQTTSGYLVRKPYLDSLLSVWQGTVSRPDNTDDPKASDIPANHIDQSWKSLQHEDPKQWVVTQPYLGYQGKSYSDIQKGVTDPRI